MFYVLDENHNLVEAYDKEGVLAVLAQAIANGSLDSVVADSAFVTQLKCCVGGVSHKMAFVTQAKYNELKESDGLLDNCMYYITDDTKDADMDAFLTALSNKVNSLDVWKAEVESGTKSVPKAKSLVPVASSTVTLTNGSSDKVSLDVGGIYLLIYNTPSAKTTGVMVYTSDAYTCLCALGGTTIQYKGKNDSSTTAEGRERFLISDSASSGTTTLKIVKIGSI